MTQLTQQQLQQPLQRPGNNLQHNNTARKQAGEWDPNRSCNMCGLFHNHWNECWYRGIPGRTPYMGHRVGPEDRLACLHCGADHRTFECDASPDNVWWSGAKLNSGEYGTAQRLGWFSM